MGDDPIDEEVPDEEDLDRLMAEADPDLATPGEKPSTDDPVASAKKSDHGKVKKELDLSNPDAAAQLDQFETAEKFEGGEVDPDEDITDPKIRQLVKQAKEIEEEQRGKEQAAAEAEETDDDVGPDTPVRVENTEPESEPESMTDDPKSGVSNSEPETPDKMQDERYQSDDSDDAAADDPFDGSDDEVADAMAEWSELTTADDIDPETFDFEDQDFEKIEGHGQEAVIPFNDVYFYLTKPEDDAAQSLMAKIQTVSGQGEMFDLIIQEVVEAPDMTQRIKTWDFWDRAALAGRCMQFLGLADMGEF